MPPGMEGNHITQEGVWEGLLATGGGCSLAYFSAHNITYTRVCGRLIGYQFGNTRAFRGGFTASLDFNYVDGVSVTHSSPRQHIWTFAASPGETDGFRYL